jgi:hypothetical protein
MATGIASLGLYARGDEDFILVALPAVSLQLRIG